MEFSVNSSLDWPKIEMQLRNNANKLNDYTHMRDAKRIINNIAGMVSELSKRELTMRTSPGRNPLRVNEQKALINSEIDALEQWITLLLLY